MADSLDTLAGVIPLVVVGGIAMKMTDNMFPSDRPKKKNKKKSGKSRRPYNGRFGNFGNVGF